MSSTTAFTVPELTPVGHLGKPHGVRGELTAYLTIELETLCSDPVAKLFTSLPRSMRYPCRTSS